MFLSVQQSRQVEKCSHSSRLKQEPPIHESQAQIEGEHEKRYPQLGEPLVRVAAADVVVAAATSTAYSACQLFNNSRKGKRKMMPSFMMKWKGGFTSLSDLYLA